MSHLREVQRQDDAVVDGQAQHHAHLRGRRGSVRNSELYGKAVRSASAGHIHLDANTRVVKEGHALCVLVTQGLTSLNSMPDSRLVWLNQKVRVSSLYTNIPYCGWKISATCGTYGTVRQGMYDELSQTLPPDAYKRTLPTVQPAHATVPTRDAGLPLP